MNRATFDLIEAAAERGEQVAKDWLALISDAIRTAFDSSKILGLELDGSDSRERVAEALAVWIKESEPRRFADVTATRYSVTGVDTSADGMERLRSQSEFILLTYPAAESTPSDLAAQWLADMDSTDMGDGFSYTAAEHAISDLCRRVGRISDGQARRVEAPARSRSRRSRFAQLRIRRRA